MPGGGRTGVTSPENGIYFDYDGNGFKVKTSWADDGFGVLVHDLDYNIQVVKDENFKSFDTNNDGYINKFDKYFSNLKILKRDGSISSLDEEKIVSINTNVKYVDFSDDYGNKKFAEGSFIKSDGKIYNFEDYYFATIPNDVIEEENPKITKNILNLPNVQHKNKVHSLHYAMADDEKLLKLVKNFVKEKDDDKRVELVKEIIKQWTNKSTNEDIVETFTGMKINKKIPYEKEIIDVVYLKIENLVYSELMSQSHYEDLMKLVKYNGTNFDFSDVVKKLEKEVDKNPEKGKQRVYEFAKIVKSLNMDKNSNFFNPKDDDCYYLKLTKEDRKLQWKIDTIGKRITTEEEGTYADDAYQAGKREREYNSFHALMGDDTAYANENEPARFNTCSGNDILIGGNKNDLLFGQSDDDIIFGYGGNDLLYGGSGDDIILGGDGDDIIYPDHSEQNVLYHFDNDRGNDIIRGEKGNDVIYSVKGNDTYIFNLGDGQDKIYDSDGTDIIYFGKGISKDMLSVVKDNNDLIINIKNTKDSITVKDYFKQVNNKNNPRLNNKIEIIQFSDETIITDLEKLM